MKTYRDEHGRELSIPWGQWEHERVQPVVEGHITALTHALGLSCVVVLLDPNTNNPLSVIQGLATGTPVIVPDKLRDAADLVERVILRGERG